MGESGNKHVNSIFSLRASLRGDKPSTSLRDEDATLGGEKIENKANVNLGNLAQAL